MNNANGGNIIYHFKGNYKDLDNATKDLQKKFPGLSGAGKTAMLGVAAAVGTATAAVVGLTKKSVEAYGEYEQLQGGLVSMMHGNQDAVNQVLNTSKTAYKELQMSQSEYLNSFESSYSIIQNGLSENANAIEYTNKVIQLSADLFNTFGGSTEQYSNAINWALKGTFSYLDNLNIGIKGTQEGFIEAANASGVLGREIQSVKDVTNDEIIDVIQHYAEKAGAWGKSHEEASTTIIGSMNMVKASFQDFLSGQGGVEQVITSAIAAGKNISEAVIKLLPQVVSGIVQLIQGIIPLLPGLIKQLLPVLIQGVSALMIGIIGILPDLLNTIAEVLPSQMPVIIDAILQMIPMLIDMLPLFIKAGGQILGALLEGLVKSTPSILKGLWNILKSMISLFNGLPSNFKNAGLDIMRGLWNGIKGMKDWVINKVKSMGKSILNGLKSALGIHSPSTEFALVGKYSILGYTEGLEKMRGQLEDSIYDTFAISPQLASSSALHYSPNVIVNNQMNMSTDPLGQTVAKIKTFAGGAKNDYNYGMGV